jgi:hypothetical protein
VLKNGKIKVGCGIFNRENIEKEIKELQEAVEVSKGVDLISNLLTSDKE